MPRLTPYVCFLKTSRLDFCKGGYHSVKVTELDIVNTFIFSTQYIMPFPNLKVTDIEESLQ